MLGAIRQVFPQQNPPYGYAHCGNNQQDEIYFEELLEEPYWGGSKTNLIDTTFTGIIISTCMMLPTINSSIPVGIARFSGSGKPLMKPKQPNVVVPKPS